MDCSTTAARAPNLLEAHGMATGTAAEMLLLVGDNPERIHSEAAFAKLCGVCPNLASSGKTLRHRLNRGGNRQANAALHRVVIVRMRGHQPTLDYVHRRTAEGKSKPEIIRCLKRYVAREIFSTSTWCGTLNADSASRQRLRTVSTSTAPLTGDDGWTTTKATGSSP